jgi:hypothetical protein
MNAKKELAEVGVVLHKAPNRGACDPQELGLRARAAAKQAAALRQKAHLAGKLHRLVDRDELVPRGIRMEDLDSPLEDHEQRDVLVPLVEDDRPFVDVHLRANPPAARELLRRHLRKHLATACLVRHRQLTVGRGHSLESTWSCG